ncbi:hydroxyethylthiazole kinase [Halomonas sp. 707D7]|uniref:hydroxyethylthiazole kinase n=2 Tax=unclassified Halomonas TaxID=2609666 RepID=UPI00209F9417|nr:hydroxyethylthiazole kinase [Halomonas sp. 707D7]MCP1315826.1 hydroxyethylthiazole kinase [Halomonas sp. 707D7]
MSHPALGRYLDALRDQTPLVHCMTNFVAMNSTANLMLAIGASPAMLHAQEEAPAFTELAQALSINIGTISPPWAESMLACAEVAGLHSTPWVLDPVAVGATRYRQTLCEALLARAPWVIRANVSEVLALAGLESKGRGVDADPAAQNAEHAAVTLARQQGCVVAMTGERDFVTDGARHARVSGGHFLMPRVTTLGCGLSAIVAAFVAASPDDRFEATVAALASFALAGREAGERAKGPGSFQVELLDALYRLTPDALSNQTHWEVVAQPSGAAGSDAGAQP